RCTSTRLLFLSLLTLTLSSQYFNNTYINHNLLTTPSSKTEAAACPAGGCGSAPPVSSLKHALQQPLPRLRQRLSQPVSQHPPARGVYSSSGLDSTG
ncbi:hypothetical protein N7445_008585, partial [Penicillium cf. griseofulvum]